MSTSKKSPQKSKRKSGEPYIIHPIQVALHLAKKYRDEDLVIAGIIHDTVEDDDNTDIEEVYDKFGNDVWWIVDSVTKINNYFYIEPELRFKDKIEKLLHGGIRDVRCLILKNCDRQNNLSTLWNLPEHKQIRMTFETQAIYKPLQGILRCEDQYSPVDTRRARLDEFLKENNIKNIKEFKETLYNHAFHDLNDELFSMVYANTASIVWKIEDKEMYMQLINFEDFDENVEILNLEQDSDWNFRCNFRYKKWQIFDWMNQLDISSFNK